VGKTLVSPMSGDDSFSATLEFASGSLGTMESCYHMIPSDNILEVYGDRGTIRASLEIILAGHQSSAQRRIVDFQWQTW
jgi:predicted dehydrogenase